MSAAQAELPLVGLYPLRDRVRLALRDGEGLTVAALSGALGEKAPAVRHHLLRLMATGEAHQRIVPVPGRGRVALYYAAPPAPSSGVRLRVVQDEGFPRTVAECPEGPCPWFRCRHHLGAHVTPSGTLQLQEQYLPDDADDGEWSPPEPCSLRRAEAGESDLDQIGEAMGLTGERVRQIQGEAFARVSERRAALRGLL